MAHVPLPKTYDFRSVEERLYKWWEERGYFQPRPVQGARPFVISMPPPNVTGELHLGHAMFVAVEDLMIRYHRMRGEPVLWVPGTDHAGIATQLQVEKDLLRTEEVTREELGREKFVERVWQWKEKYGGIITQQLRRLGASCDWERERFTLEPGLSRAVREAFVRLYEKGLVYRGTYLINWSPGLKTAVSDLEVEYHEEQVTLYYFQYRLQGSSEFIPVATTRPETILGDTAVAVHPEDDRYRKYIGLTVLVPMQDRPIPVIADSYVDREFGTGALKITPGHDPADYEIAKRHELPILSVLNPDATMNEMAGPYAGLDRYACREKLWADMKTAGLTIKTEPYLAQIPRSQRGGEVIEPLISTQWFVKIGPLADPALEAVRSGGVRLVPERFAKIYFNWLENIRDWCISRQLWWGHRIPAWHCAECHEITVTRQDPDRCAHCGSTQIAQDPDVLDTWFSSGLWPFSTLGWPDDTPDYRTFYPTSVLETGPDILFFWVARMIMLGLEFTGHAPFHTVYLHGTVRDTLGRRMSKTLGNGIDPLWILDGAAADHLPDYARKQYPAGLPAMGTDALRFTLLTASSPGKDLNLNLEAVEANRNFANKLWNIGRFVISAIQECPAMPKVAVRPLVEDVWILSSLNDLLATTDRLFGSYEFGEAGRKVHEFLWGSLADVYIELTKPRLRQGGPDAWQAVHTLVRVLDSCLRLLHPFTPFVTEELWSYLRAECVRRVGEFDPKLGWEDALIVARWPNPYDISVDAKAIAAFEEALEGSRRVLNEKAKRGLSSRLPVSATMDIGQYSDYESTFSSVYSSIASASSDFVPPGTVISDDDHIPLVLSGSSAFLKLPGAATKGAQMEHLREQLATIEARIGKKETLLKGDFAEKAPTHIVDKEKQDLEALSEERRKLKAQLAAFEE
jgi:valyl-tRNA synthetase